MKTIANPVAYDWMFEEGTVLDLTPEGRERRTTALLSRWENQVNEFKTLQGIMLMPHAQDSLDTALFGIVFHFGKISDRLDAIHRQTRIDWLGEVMQGMNRKSKSYKDAQEQLAELEAKQAEYKEGVTV